MNTCYDKNIINDESLSIICGGIEDTNRKFIDQYALKVGMLCYVWDFHREEVIQVVIIKVYEDPHSFLWIDYTKRRAQYISCKTGELGDSEANTFFLY